MYAFLYEMISLIIQNDLSLVSRFFHFEMIKIYPNTINNLMKNITLTSFAVHFANVELPRYTGKF